MTSAKLLIKPSWVLTTLLHFVANVVDEKGIGTWRSGLVTNVMTFQKYIDIFYATQPLTEENTQLLLKQNQSVVKLFLNTDLKNEIEGNNLVANESKKFWNAANQLLANHPSITSWIAGAVINYRARFCIFKKKTFHESNCRNETQLWHF